MMRKFKFHFYFHFLSVCLCVYPLSLPAEEATKLRSRVTDTSGTLSPNFIVEMERKLATYEKDTSNQIVILMINTLSGRPIEEFALEVAETTKLGQKDKDNGVLLLIAKDDRELRIEVGYGLEGVLTDVLCNRIINREITPHFKSADYEQGIQQGIESIIGGIGGTYTVPPPKDYSYLGPLAFFGELDGGGENIPWLFRLGASLFVVFVLGIFTYAAATTPYVGWFLYFFLFPFWSLFPIALHGVDIGVAVFLTYVIGIGLIKIYLLITPSGRKWMKKYGASVGGSGSSRSGSGWSSGRSSGGFSGGGGSFGGGGSSGSW